MNKHLRVLDAKPLADIALCSNCGWKGPVKECPTDQDGDWETGYYTIHLCPKCSFMSKGEDGGCIDDYEYSDAQWREYNEWEKSVTR